jgi:electron transfer flavoprotein alpha/beta subunit
VRIVVCVKEVLDPDAVNNYALAGRLEIGADGKSLTQAAIPRLMNGFDEQALEAALRLKDAGLDCTITVRGPPREPLLLQLLLPLLSQTPSVRPHISRHRHH